MSSYTIRVILGVQTTVTAGAAGRGVPPGGTAGQVLAKASDGPFDTEWVDPEGGPGGSGDVVGPASSVDGRMVVFSGTTGKLIAEGTKTGAQVAAHIDSTSNPHATTAAQVGADPAGTAATAVAAHEAAVDPHPQYTTSAEAAAAASSAVATHAAAAGAHDMAGVSGLAAALALLAPLASPSLTGAPTAPTAAPGTSSTRIATTEFVALAIAALIGSVPGTLDTLQEIADALGDDPNFAATITAALTGKLAKASNLADLTDAGAAIGNLGASTIGGQVFTAATAAAIRALLELGGAALLAVGTGAATVAAGDDSRITNAVPSTRNVSAQHSVTGGGNLSSDRTFQLDGDVASPGNLKMYGTNGSGVRGWYDQPSGGGSPGGSGSELQYRSGASSFGAVAGSHYDAVNGRVSFGAGTSPSAVGHFACDSASERVLIAQAAASQSANIFEVRSSAGAVYSAFNYWGNLKFAQNTFGLASIAYDGSTNAYITVRQHVVAFGYGGGEMVQWLGGNPGELAVYAYNTPITLGTGPLRGKAGSGTNGAGGDLYLAAGRSTGNATPRKVILQSTAAGASGSTAQTLVDVLTVTDAATLTASDAVNIAVGTTTGTKIGTAATQKIGCWGATPVVQPAAIADATDAPSAITQLNDLLSKLRAVGIIAT